MAAAHPLGCACTVDILNAAPEPVRRKIKVNSPQSSSIIVQNNPDFHQPQAAFFKTAI
jgi:hypothetical protein